MERRNFVKNISAASAALMFTPSITAFSQSLSASPASPGGLLPFILFEDCNALILQSAAISNNFKELLTGDIHKPINGNFARLAGSFSNYEKMIELLKQLKADKAAKTIPLYYDKLTFALGWLVARASMKEIGLLNQKLVGKGQPIDQIRAYQDVEVIRARFVKEGATVSASDFSSLMLQMITRAVTRIHTLTPDKNDGGNWIIRTSDWRENNLKTMQLYGQVMENPDLSKQALYCMKGNFIRKSDPVIADGFKPELLGKSNKSQYAASLENGYNSILTFQMYMYDKVGADSLIKFL